MSNIKKDVQRWRKSLSAEEYQITREKGTERAFTGKFYNHKEKGTYLCKCCNAELFSSDKKYDSGSGWPSFYDKINPQNIKKIEDLSYGMIRTEVLCSNCEAHLGHLFDDGPQPTGERYCINSASLEFKKSDC